MLFVHRLGRRKQAEGESLDSLETNFDPEDFDLATGKRPNGWAAVKLRRVYIKEWRDRKEGVDEETIMERRYQREQEAESEMIQEMSVHGRIRAFERAIQRNKTGGNDAKSMQTRLEGLKKGLIHNNPVREPPRRASYGFKEKSSKQRGPGSASQTIADFMVNVNRKLENLADKVNDNLTEANTQNAGESPPRFYDRPLAKSPGPRLAAPRAQSSAYSQSALRKTPMKTDRMHVRTLNVTPQNFDRNDSSVRPVGWLPLLARRVEERESRDRLAGTDDVTIVQRRQALIKEVESEMEEEASSLQQQRAIACNGEYSNGDYSRSSSLNTSPQRLGSIAVKGNPLLRKSPASSPQKPETVSKV